MNAFEDELTLRQVAELYPGRAGKGVHVDTVHRWIVHGCRGVRLWAFKRGGRWYTTRAAIEKFERECTGSRFTMKPRTAAEREQAIAAARESLRLKGFYGKKAMQAGPATPKPE